VTGIDDTIARIEAYQETGIDAIFLIGIKQKQQLEVIASECKLPLFLGGAGADIMDLDYLASQGVSLCLQGHQPVMAAMQATYDTLKALREGTKPSVLNNHFDKDLIRQWSKVDVYDQWMQDFLE
jgi:carboxyvinyl-carboxyphosphonate phosphorylmutase